MQSFGDLLQPYLDRLARPKGLLHRFTNQRAITRFLFLLLTINFQPSI